MISETPFPQRPAGSVSLGPLAGFQWALRQAVDADAPFLQELFASFRADEMQRVAWTQELKIAFLRDQFRLQHHHFVTHFPATDFWIVERLHPPASNTPIGRFYLDRSTPFWRVIDIGFLPEVRGRGLGTHLLKWAQSSALQARSQGIDLHVLCANMAAERLYLSLGFKPEGMPEGYYRRMEWRAASAS